MGRKIRNPAIAAREMDDDVFLVSTDNEAVFHLNAVGAAIWKLLETPADEADVAQTLIDAFPDIPADQVRQDVQSLFRDLDHRGFLIDAD